MTPEIKSSTDRNLRKSRRNLFEMSLSDIIWWDQIAFDENKLKNFLFFLWKNEILVNQLIESFFLLFMTFKDLKILLFKFKNWNNLYNNIMICSEFQLVQCKWVLYFGHKDYVTFDRILHLHRCLFEIWSNIVIPVQ